VYSTLEEAREAVRDGIADCLGDNPELCEDEVAWDIIQAVAGFSVPEVRKELLRIELGI